MQMAFRYGFSSRRTRKYSNGDHLWNIHARNAVNLSITRPEVNQQSGIEKDVSQEKMAPPSFYM